MENKKVQTTAEYIKSAHRLGRIGILVAVVIMLAMPTIMGAAFDAFPSIGMVLQASVGLLAIFVPVGISEVISYTPVLGSSIYLTLITGNIMNLKLPVATNALKIMDIEYGTEDADVMSGIAVGISTLVTISVIALGVVLMIPLQPVLSIPEVKTATNYILPALFGTMGLSMMSDSLGGGIRAKKRLLGAVVPTLVVGGLFIVSPTLVASFQGVLILLMLPVTYFGTKLLYKKGWIKVIMPGEDAAAKE